jgi:hypothetical protein
LRFIKSSAAQEPVVSFEIFTRAGALVNMFRGTSLSADWKAGLYPLPDTLLIL